jgi:WD40 repeat protein
MRLGKRKKPEKKKLIDFKMYINSSTVVLYDINKQKQDFIINTARKAITSLSLSPDGRYLATGEVNKLFFYSNIIYPIISVWTRSKSTCLGFNW